ncbi:MAG: ABC transporter ATP-binding protein, partial [Dehalococcoidia bacterium]
LMREASQRTSLIGGTRLFTRVQHEIAIHEVSFSYNHSTPALQDVTVTIPATKLTAIVGPSGMGKSTFLDLIGRLADPNHGVILMDGVDVREFDLPSLRRGIGVVSQDILLFNDSILANIKYARPEANDVEVEEAARRANAHQFIEGLPQAYNTLLGHRGLTLSGGERQRLALARALLGNPSILLLDEVTSNLDAESERLIQESIFQAAQERTVIVVAHRLSMVQRADKVIVLDNGRVVEEGTPQELSKRGGLFQYYQDLQLGTR